MKTIIPTITMIIGITIMTCVSICLITFQLQITGARNFHAGCIDSIEAGYGNETVINRCIDEAAEKGYRLEVTDDGIYDDRPCYKVVLNYNASILLFGLQKPAVIEGFAR
ncbi:MAG: hypothetical protein PUB87_04815 [Eubacteriaceae bacterium]|nr:hypothetical protein [Eubacteriaceae bacterium]